MCIRDRVATVLVAHSGLVPEGSSRSRAASELAEMFARADGETEALPDKGQMCIRDRLWCGARLCGIS